MNNNKKNLKKFVFLGSKIGISFILVPKAKQYPICNIKLNSNFEKDYHYQNSLTIVSVEELKNNKNLYIK